MGRKYSSSTNWEGSMYGGFEKILRDYPSIKIPWDVKHHVPEGTKVPWVTTDKLNDVFQFKVKEYKLHDYLLAHSQIEQHSEYKYSYYSDKKRDFLVPSKQGISDCVNHIKESDPELASLFHHYEDLLCDTKILYKLPEEDGSDGDGSGGDGKSKLGEESKGDADAKLKKAKEFAKGLIDESKKYEPFSWTASAASFSSDFKELKKQTTFRSLVHFKGKVKAVKYNADQTLASSKLVDLLDINFDPKQDKVDNLRNGKLDISKIATVPSGNTKVYYTVEENISTKPFSVCILMDESGSMDQYRSGGKFSSPCYYQHDLVKILYKTFSQILPKDKLYVYGHSGDEKTHAKPEIRVYHDPYNQNFEDVFEAQGEVAFNENYDGIVIEKIYDHIRSRTSENILFISISDGYPSGVSYGGHDANDEMKRVIEKCRRDGFVTVGIGFNHGGVKELYNYSTSISDLKESPKLVSALLNRVVKLEFQDE